MNKYAFIHIEKCAGTSLHKILEFNDSKYWVLNPKVYYTNGEDYPLGIKDTKRILDSPFVNGIGGHSIRPYRLEEKQLPFSFTFLRDPCERYVSHYVHQKYRMGIKRSFKSYLDEEYYCNFITKSLSIIGNLEEAEKILYAMGYIGIMDDFENCINELNNTIFNNKLKIYKSHEMKSVSSKVSNDILSKYKNQIQSRNEKDLYLYKMATSSEFRSRYNIQKTEVEFAKITKLKNLKRKMLRLIKNKTWSYL